MCSQSGRLVLSDVRLHVNPPFFDSTLRYVTSCKLLGARHYNRTLSGRPSVVTKNNLRPIFTHRFNHKWKIGARPRYKR